jgi:hypothetical protein
VTSAEGKGLGVEAGGINGFREGVCSGDGVTRIDGVGAGVLDLGIDVTEIDGVGAGVLGLGTGVTKVDRFGEIEGCLLSSLTSFFLIKTPQLYLDQFSHLFLFVSHSLLLPK